MVIILLLSIFAGEKHSNYYFTNNPYEYYYTMRTRFTFNTEWYEIIKDCPVTVKGEVFSAVMEYAINGTVIEISNEAKVIFLFIKREIDRRDEETRKRRERRQRSRVAAVPRHEEAHPEKHEEVVPDVKMAIGTMEAPDKPVSLPITKQGELKKQMVDTLKLHGLKVKFDRKGRTGLRCKVKRA